MRRLLGCLVALSALGCGAIAARAETRAALVIGNSSYRSTTQLSNPRNDAQDMSGVLKAVGFDVVEALDADKRKFDAAVRDFTDKLANADVALFFYAGHGLQVGLDNYLVPVDARLERERDLEFEAVKLDFVLRQMEIDREGKTTIVILDACRDNPIARNLARSMGARSTAIGRGLAPAATGLGTFIAYSTQPGNVALDGQGRNSPFSAALVKHVGAKGRSLTATMIEVRNEVVAATGGSQVPWDHSALTADFYFVPGAIASAPTGSTADLAALQQRLRKLEEDAKRREGTAVPPANTTPPSPRIEVKGAAASAKSTAAPAGPAALSIKINARLSRKEHGFDIYEGVAVMGEQLRMGPTDSNAGCQAMCRDTPGCAAATYNDFFRGKNVACLIYRDVTDLMKVPTSTLMVRGD